MKRIDYRSDTVTWPTKEMRYAMAEAEVGDDVFGDVNLLELEVAELFGKEAALFVTSGTQGNLVSLLAHCRHGDEVILGDTCHILNHEGGGIAALGGIASKPVKVQEDGTMRLDDVRKAIRPDDPHYPVTRLIAIENTQNEAGGVALSKEYMDSLGQLAHQNGLALHVDGARIFNAAAFHNVSVKDSISFCLSKGLCAPVGAMVVGSKDFISLARRKRKMVGGGLRQTGVLAAAALIAIRTMAPRVGEDHKTARQLADGLGSIKGITNIVCHTNMVYFDYESEKPYEGLVARSQQEGIILIDSEPGDLRIRMVTHYYISSEHIEKTLRVFSEYLDD